MSAPRSIFLTRFEQLLARVAHRPKPIARGLAGFVCLLWVCAAALSLSACAPGDAAPTPEAAPTRDTGLPETLVTFEVQIPSLPPPDKGISLVILDEVTGLSLNAQRYTMQALDETHYRVQVPLTVGAVAKYRYARNGTIPAEEHTSDGRPVRYRLMQALPGALAQDVVTRWSDGAFFGDTGRIYGQAADLEGRGIPNMLIAVGGFQTFTAADGSFRVEGLPPGLHTITAYSLDGGYKTFQQGALVAAGATTPAQIALTPSEWVDVQFVVRLPADTPPGVPVRLVGNLSLLGNTFASLSGGVSVSAARAPVLTPLPDGRHGIVLRLPVGADVRYKYTLGDGFWNAERAETGGFVLRQLIVPTEGLTLEDTAASWSDGKSARLVFDVNVPDETPAGEFVSIQFNAFGWTEPIPMWRLGEHRWAYFLYAPVLPDRPLGYRYCRNQQCGSADDAATPGLASAGRQITPGSTPQTLSDVVKQWYGWDAKLIQPSVAQPITFTPRAANFVRGVEFQTDYLPSWAALYPVALQHIRAGSANWVTFSPSWTFTRQNPPALGVVAGEDALWQDVDAMITQAQRENLQVALFPQPHIPGDVAEWWASGARDFSWWVVWFENYRTFILHHAELAARNDVPVLILGGEWLQPALPGGVLIDGSPSGVPADAEQRWRDLIADVRAIYNGEVWWGLPYAAQTFAPPPFLDAVDAAYVLWQPALSTKDYAEQADLYAQAVRLLQQDIRPLAEVSGKPVILAVGYPSANGGIVGCVPHPEGGCVAFTDLARPRAEILPVQLDLQEQVDVYAAMLQAANEQMWLHGFVTRGFYPAAALQDKSLSVYGKPAEWLVWQGFEAWRGAP